MSNKPIVYYFSNNFNVLFNKFSPHSQFKAFAERFHTQIILYNIHEIIYNYLTNHNLMIIIKG